MEVRKESNGLKNSMVTREELAIINQFTKRALKEDEVYTFAKRFVSFWKAPAATIARWWLLCWRTEYSSPSSIRCG